MNVSFETLRYAIRMETECGYGHETKTDVCYLDCHKKRHHNILSVPRIKFHEFTTISLLGI